jgi:hypothetical protein
MDLASGSPNLRKHIDRFAASITSDPLRFALHRPEQWCQPGLCFNNVDEKVKRDGGQRLCGWIFNLRRADQIENGDYLIAVNHAVWRPPRGPLIDVTPYSHAIHTPIGPAQDRGWFLPDLDAAPVTAAMPSKFYALLDSPQLATYLEELASKEALIEQETLANPKIEYPWK